MPVSNFNISIRKLRLYEVLGAAEVINSTEKDVVKTVHELTGGVGVDLVIETSGAESAANQGIAALKKGGTLVFVGYSKNGMMNLSIGSALDKELTMKTIFRYRHIYPLAIDAVNRGLVDIKNIATNVFDFDDIQKGMDESVHNKVEIVKSVIKIAP
ncbi:MAG: zinc-binding dehydrogenase [Spirochaetaceae bacterium]|jgi:L-iditol 2-dehydrogenase|nr:zinc-binding dehydrogenase [Spirochaetaceae bacterium]